MKNIIYIFYSYKSMIYLTLIYLLILTLSTSQASTISTGQIAIGKFNTLPLFDPTPYHDNVFSTAYFISIGSDENEICKLIFKFYEDSLQEEPFETIKLSINYSPIPFFYSFYHGDNKWADLQGIITMEVVSGSVDFDYFEIETYSNGARYKGNANVIIQNLPTKRLYDMQGVYHILLGRKLN